jgi:tetratricopeptide (TPR) repeat protein
MQPSIGEIIRLVRQLRNMTQRELAGDRFSKSYVSAVERNRIAPSPRALRFFAQRLGQPNGNFAALLQQPDVAQAVSVLDTRDGGGRRQADAPTASLHPAPHPFARTRDDTITLLQTLLEQSAFASFSPDHHLPTISPEALASLPHHLQARYYFLLGLHAKEQHNLTVALNAFESALALAPAHQQAAILDEMGSCSFQLRSYHTALGYHLHARHILSVGTGGEGDFASVRTSSRTSAPLLLAVELHCGEACRALGAYQQALSHYESARQELSAQHDLSTAGKLYSGLGYCTFASIYPATMPFASSALSTNISPEEIEHEFQRALSFYLQSRSFYQVSGDRLEEAFIRLMIASILLDLSTRQRRRMISSINKEFPTTADAKEVKGYPQGTPLQQASLRGSTVDCTRLLDDAAEQCQQVLLGWQDQLEHPSHPVDAKEFPTTADAGLLKDASQARLPRAPQASLRVPMATAELDTQLYVALACLVRVSIQRAILARLEGSSLDVAYRQRAFAAYLCQQVLDTLANPSLPTALIQQAVTTSADTLAYRSPSLPRLIEIVPDVSDSSPRSPLSLIEVYIAMGEVAEELGRVAPVSSYAHDCYTQANQSFQAALSLAHSIQVKGERDPGYLARLYQHYIALLEERAVASLALAEETTKALLGVLKDAFRL